MADKIGETGGSLYVWQGKWIREISPDIAVIEQTANARNINGGEDLQSLVTELEKDYVVHIDVIRVWHYGDVSNRTRLFLVCVHRRHGLKASQFKFPLHKFDTSRYPTAADIAQPDFDVPSQYLLRGEPKHYEEASNYMPKPGTMHSVARFGHGAGNRERPNAVQSHFGLPATQLTSNGCSRRTMLSWKPGDKIDMTRLSTPAETMAMASLDSSYQTWANQFAMKDEFGYVKPVEFLQKCINNGVPMGTSYAIDKTVKEFLEWLGVEPDIPATDEAMTVNEVKFDTKLQSKTKEWQNAAVASAVRKQYGHIKSMLVDTGAQLSCSHTSMSQSMKDKRPSGVRVGTAKANAGNMVGIEDGTASIMVMNTDRHEGYKRATPFEFETTTFNDLQNELFSFDDPYRNGNWNMALRQPDFENGDSGMYRPARDGKPESKIPFRYDWDGNGGFYIDYTTVNSDTDMVYMAELMDEERRNQDHANSEQQHAMLMNNSYTPQRANLLIQRLMVHPATRSAKIAGAGNVRRSRRLQGAEPETVTPENDTVPDLLNDDGSIQAKVQRNVQPKRKVPATQQQRKRRKVQSEDESITIVLPAEVKEEVSEETLEMCMACDEHDEDHDVVRSDPKVNPQLQTGETSFLARHEDEKAVKGTKTGLPHGVSKMKYMTFHRSRGHCGNAEDCDICKYVKGNMRRITKKIDPHRETREMYSISMDMVNFSHRSVERSKYMITMRDAATGWFKFLYLYLKSDAPQAIKEAILELRADPMYQGYGYPAIQRIHTDEAGEWGLKSKAWNAIKRELEIEVEYRTPETSRPLGHAEKTNSTAEVMIKSILMEENLPKDHWQAAARGAEFLLNRFPNIATDTNAPVDGDVERPLEKATRGRYSRRQIDKELAYYVQPGRIGLVHLEKVKGCQLKPKVRWGVAWGMYKEQVIWKCPFKGSTFRSKSFTAFELSSGMNYFQFLGIPYNEKTLAKGALALKEKHDKVDIHLPEPREVNEKAPRIPIVQQQVADDAGVVFDYTQDTAVGGNGNQMMVHPQNELKGYSRVFAPSGNEMVTNEKGILHEREGVAGTGG